MYRDLLNAICCPVCRSAFRLEEQTVVDDEVIEGILTCGEGHRYAIRGGVVDFCSKEQNLFNQWSEAYKKTDYETVDKEVEALKSETEKTRQKMVLDSFASELSEMDKGYIVDIASGRGMLLTRLARSIKHSVSLIATDLSFEVLMYDRLKVKKIDPNVRVDYLACDATAMPLKSEAVDAVVSFYGIANMYGIAEGIKESSRILKPNGRLLNSFVLIREDSKGYKNLEKVYAENHLADAEKGCLEEEIRNHHRNCFSDVSCNFICEGTYEERENKLDLLPYPGEWFAEVIFNCKK